jgi:indolepyruvate ferredoxin oxidoreductase beta subunit
MKTDIMLAGVGGQGILSIAAIISMAALKNNLHIKQAEVHGMSQRGGSVQSNLRISDRYIASDIIPLGSADIILSVEPMESLRYLPFLSRNGWLVTNTTPFPNIPDYPDTEELIKEIKALPQHVLIDADKIAAEFGSQKSSNMVILGAASPYIGIPFESIKESIDQKFSRKGPEIVNLNIQALEAGREFARLNATALP